MPFSFAAFGSKGAGMTFDTLSYPGIRAGSIFSPNAFSDGLRRFYKRGRSGVFDGSYCHNVCLGLGIYSRSGLFFRIRCGLRTVLHIGTGFLRNFRTSCPYGFGESPFRQPDGLSPHPPPLSSPLFSARSLRSRFPGCGGSSQGLREGRFFVSIRMRCPFEKNWFVLIFGSLILLPDRWRTLP